MDVEKDEVNLNIFTLYYQTKQRIDLDVDFHTKRIICKTKLTFLRKDEEIFKDALKAESKSLDDINRFSLKLNAENMQIKNCWLILKNKSEELLQKEMRFMYFNTECKDFYLKNLYNNIEDLDSFRNLNRIEWEARQEGNLEIFIEKQNLIKDNIELTSFYDKFKLVIEYEIEEKFIGVIFQSFYDEKLDCDYDICYTPNFYFNTPHWVPCLYLLKSQILWRLYVIVSTGYSVYSSLQLDCLFQDSVQNKQAFSYRSKEPLSPNSLGFIIVYDKILTRMDDPINKNILYVINENKRERLEKSFINNGLTSAVYSFYEEFFESDSCINANMNTFIIFVPYLSIDSFSGNYNKFLSVKDDHYFSMVKFPNMYILPEKLLYNDTIPDTMEYQLKNIGKIFISNYLGGLINESDYADFWLMCGLENWLSDHFLLKCFGQNYLKNKLYKYMTDLKKIAKSGKEKRPLFTNYFSHPAELQFDSLIYLKSTLVIHLLEAQVEKAFLQKALKNIINERQKNNYLISTESFIKIFKKNCGVNLKHFMQLWVYKTGMLCLNINYSFNKRTNSIDLEIYQTPVAQHYFHNNPHFKIKDINLDGLENLNKKLAIVDFKVRPLRYFDVDVPVMIYQTNGIEIMRESHQIKLDNERESIYQNFPLSAKIRKAPIKKREQEFIQELISNTSIGKLYPNEEIEKILTQNCIMWVKADPDLTLLRNVKITQQHIIYDYIKLFKEGEIIGQYESLKNIYKNTPKENWSHSLSILETFIRSPTYYKLRLKAIKIYVKIILKMKYEEGYKFLLEYLEDSYSEILKNKTCLNRDSYFILKKIIKFLGNYREDYFNEYFVIGRVTNSSIQTKIIDKFLAILISNDLNIISGFNDSYIVMEILLGCSKLNLQEKTLYLLKKIVKLLRIEKLKRSFNEIIVLASIRAFVIVLIKNEFFSQNFNNEKQNLGFNNDRSNSIKLVVNEIFTEINFYVNSECENFELKVFIDFFQIYLIFYKCKNFYEFCRNVYPFIFLKLQDVTTEANEKSQSETISPYELTNVVSKILSLDMLFSQVDITFETLNEKLELMSFIKEILFSNFVYHRIDVRLIVESLFNKILNKSVVSSDKKENTITINSNTFLNNMNKNWLNFVGKRWADEEWLYSFSREERRDEMDGMKLNSEMDSETYSRYGMQLSLIQKYQIKYPKDSYAVFNSNLDLENKSWEDSCNIILEKLINHPLAYPFCLPLNNETLGELYDQYHSIIKHPIELTVVKEKLLNQEYNNINEFNRDILLIFSNCRDFNVRGSELHESANQLEDYFKILTDPIRKKNLENIYKNDVPEIKIKLQGEEIIN
jgi:hypothetical protein